MGQFSIERFLDRTSDGEGLNIFSARFRNIRDLPEQERIVIDAAFAHNLPSLAHKYLQDVNLWWAILMYNGLRAPIEDIVPGLTLRIPNKAALVSLLESKQTSSDNVMRI